MGDSIKHIGIVINDNVLICFHFLFRTHFTTMWRSINITMTHTAAKTTCKPSLNQPAR